MLKRRDFACIGVGFVGAIAVVLLGLKWHISHLHLTWTSTSASDAASHVVHVYPGCSGHSPPVTPLHQPKSEWLNSQVQFWYGDLYSLVLEGSWDVIKSYLHNSSYGQHVRSFLSIYDTTEEKVRMKYRDFGVYKHKDNAFILCDMLQHAPPGKRFDPRHRFPILMVDSIGQQIPVIGYVRSINPGQELAILWPWQYHFEIALQGLLDKRSFITKKHSVVGRFALSGPVRHIKKYHAGLTKTSRLSLVHTWLNASAWTDLGISLVPEGAKAVVANDVEVQRQLDSVTKKSMNLEEMMQYKYVLCIEGADISSGFGWVLASNSVPFHPYPFIYHVWYFNGLQPWIHFVPILPDGSDLDKAFAWCEMHRRKCEEIALAGRKHMLTMLDVDYITRIKQEVVRLWDLRE